MGRVGPMEFRRPSTALGQLISEDAMAHRMLRPERSSASRLKGLMPIVGLKVLKMRSIHSGDLATFLPDNCVFLVDTYDTVQGIKNAIQVGNELKQKGKNLNGIRIDSGDLAYYSKIARQMLNKAGFNETRILASSDLDEWLIESLKQQGAQIDIWCVGTRLMTSYQTPALGVVYKLMAVDHGDGRIVPRIKISHNPNKVTNPGVKKIVRFYNGGNRMIGDLLTQEDESVPHSRPVMAHHPMYDYMKKVYRPPFKAKELMVPVFLNGKQVYKCPPLIDVRNRAIEQLDALEPEFKRFSNPHIYKVSLSEKLYRVKKEPSVFPSQQVKVR